MLCFHILVNIDRILNIGPRAKPRARPTNSICDVRLSTGGPLRNRPSKNALPLDGGDTFPRAITSSRRPANVVQTQGRALPRCLAHHMLGTHIKALQGLYNSEDLHRPPSSHAAHCPEAIPAPRPRPSIKFQQVNRDPGRPRE